jgi:hypothetical protein
MCRLVSIILLLGVSACAGTNASASDPRARVAPESGKSTPASPPEEEVPEWLRKKPKGDPSTAATLDRLAAEQRGYMREFNRIASTINLSDGVDAVEAAFLAGAFFMMEFGVCGATEPPRDGGAEWLVRPRVGATGHPLAEFIRVDKSTGGIRYGSGSSTEASSAIEFKRHYFQENLEEIERRRSSP